MNACWKKRLGIASMIGGLFAAGCASAQGWSHHGRGDWGNNPERAEKMVNRLLSRVDASEEQKKKVAAIVKTAMGDMKAIRDKHRNGRRATAELLSKPTIDRNALEALRAEQIQSADAASRRMTQALADAAEVLNPEQRAKLGDRLKSRMDGGRHGHGHGRG